jgi:signal transduction histidine kinase
MKFFTTVYALLLCYIIAALSFWWISLGKQSVVIFNQEMSTLRQSVDSNSAPVLFAQKASEIGLRKVARGNQYIGEGVTFLVVILIGAAVVYHSFRRSINLSKQQRNFMLSVTHELKSPIAAMKLSMQTMQKHKLDEAKQKQLLGRCVTEADRLNDLCNNILIASQMEGGLYENAPEQIDLSQLLQYCFDAYNARYPNRFVADIADGIHVLGDELLIQLAINNLLENAVKYTLPEEFIKVVLTRNGQKVLLQIIDRGVGIADAEKKKVFEKFYRIGSEETRKAKGTGLGLYLTKMIIQQSKGSILVKDNKPSGCIFEISLPYNV